MQKLRNDVYCAEGMKNKKISKRQMILRAFYLVDQATAQPE